MNDNEISQFYFILNNFTVGPILGSLKIILLFPWLSLWFLLAWILTSLRAPFVWMRVIDVSFGRIALGLMGFYASPRKRMIIRPAIPALARQYENFSLHSEKGTSPSDSIQPGDWIVSNLSSYCDLIYHWYWFSAVATIVTNFEDGTLEQCPNRFKVFFHYFLKEHSLPNINSTTFTNTRNTNANKFNDFDSREEYPILIFPEGVSSNGRGVLKFIANLNSARRNQRIHLTCTKLHSLLFNPTYPGPPSFIHFLSHLWKLCCQLENNVTARTILPAALFSSNFDLPSASDNPQQYNRTLQQIIAALGHLRPLNLQASDKISFIKSFKE